MRYRLFFYGTLSHEMSNTVSSKVHHKLKGGEAGCVKGRLYAIPHSKGFYPALIPDELGYRIFGHVYEADSSFGYDDLDLLDEYEEFYPDDLASSEYLRKSIRVTTKPNKSVSCEVYVYNDAIPSTALEITNGNFATFMNEHGFPIYGENKIS